MKIEYFQINAFTSDPFGGNPAGICILDRWLPDELMQSIARENDLSETAFVITRAENGAHPLRWFTPAVEVDLCGHATLATAHLLFETGVADGIVRFSTLSGILTAEKRGDIVEMDFPARPAAPCETPELLVRALGKRPVRVLKSRDYLAVFESPSDILSLRPDFNLLKKLDGMFVAAAAPGEDCDFVSRLFAPNAGIDEDPATGSSHCTLIPYWSKKLGKKEMHARQLSKRGGELFCRDEDDRVIVGGRCREYLRGEIEAEE